MRVAGVVLAGGSGSRIDADVNKVYMMVGGRAVLAFSLLSISLQVDELVLVARREDPAHELVGGLGLPVAIVEGGATRHKSEVSALRYLAPAIERGDIGIVAIHDGARPFVTQELLSSLIDEARRTGGAIPALPVETPLLQPRLDGSMAPVLDVWRAQTPQVFWAGALLNAYLASEEEGWEGFDTAETVARYTNTTVGIVAGDPRNLKITNRDDLAEVETLASLWTPQGWTTSR